MKSNVILDTHTQIDIRTFYAHVAAASVPDFFRSTVTPRIALPFLSSVLLSPKVAPMCYRKKSPDNRSEWVSITGQSPESER